LHIREIAKYAKVSRSTVSRILNGVSTVDPAVVKKVQRVIQEHGYYPNYQAQALARGRTRTVALIVSELSGGNPFFSELMLYFERAAMKAGYEVLIGFPDIEESDDISICVTRMLQRRVEGIAILTFGMEEQLLNSLPHKHVPLVIPDAPRGFANVSSIKIDYQSGMQEAVEHLKGLGHTRICYISGNLKLSGMANRLAALKKAIGRAGLQFEESQIIRSSHTFEGGAAGIEHLLKLRMRPTALICCNDVAAIGALKALRRCGIEVPRDMSLIGLDDLHMSQHSEPALTTIRFSPVELGSLVFQALLHDIESEETALNSGKSEYRTRLVIRDSTAVKPGRRASGT
jgi:LacI family transcriptional regulator